MSFLAKTKPVVKLLDCLVIFTFIAALTAGCGGNSGGKGKADGHGELLVNGDFLKGMEGWSVIDRPGLTAAGTNRVEIVPLGQDASAVRMTRGGDQNASGCSGVSQKINSKLGPDSILTIRAMVRVDHESGNAIAGSNPQVAPEGAVQFKLIYTDSTGKQKEWYHGFNYTDTENADKDNFTKVSQGIWTKYLSGDLMPEIKAGSTLNEFQVYGLGWSFDGYASDVSLTLSK